MEEKQKTLLLVEDDVIIGMTEKKQLENKGYRVHHVSSGEAAVKKIQENEFPVDLILMDIDLGSGIDGTQAAEQIQKHKDIPVVFLSSHIEPEIVQKTEKITSYGYVVKNSGIVVLDAMIKMAFKLYQANQAEQKQKEIMAEKSEYFSATLNSIGDAVITTDVFSRITNMNPVAQSLTRWKIAEARDRPLSDVFRIINAKTREPAENPVEKAVAHGKIVGLANHTILIAKDLSEYQIADSAAPIKDAAANLIGVVLVFRDVTREYALQETIKISEARIQSVLSSIPDMVSLHDSDMNILFSNWNGFGAVPEEKKIYGGKCHKIYRDQETICPDCRAKETLKTGRPLEEEAKLPDGKWVELRVLPIKDADGNYTSFVEWVRDISAQKKAEQELRIKSFALDNSLDAIGISTPSGEHYYQNKAFDLLFGSAGEDPPNSIFADPQSGRKVFDTIISGKTWQGEIRMKSTLGKVLDIFLRAYPVRDATGKICALVGVHTDITARKKNETEQKSQYALLEIAGKTAGFGGWRFEADTQKLVWSEAVAQIHGMPVGCQPTIEEAINFYAPQCKDRITQVFTECLEKGIPYNEEMEIIDPGGRTVQVRTIGQAVKDEKGRIIRVEGSFQDITETKQKHEALLKSEDRLSKIMLAANDGMWDWDLQTNAVYFDPRYYRMAGYAVNAFPHRLEEFKKRVHPEDVDRVMSEAEKTLSGEIKRFEVEFQFLKKNGEWMWIAGRGIIVKRDPEGAPLRFVGTHQDITARKRAEAEIQKQLSEKEVLLREVHHRVKNNIANIESFLGLQARSSENPEVLAALQNALSRVQSMRVLFDKLLLSKDFRDVSIKSYIEELIDSLLKVFRPATDITITTEIDEFLLSSQKAVPVGIIVNELLTNVFKYAFSGRHRGTVRIAITRTGTTAALTVHDDGIGIDERKEMNRSPGFGLTIVKMLAEQLKGTYQVSNEKGTKSVIRFEL